MKSEMDSTAIQQIFSRVDREKALTDFHRARRDSDEFSGPKGFETFEKATDTLAKELGGPTYNEWLKEEQNDD